MQKRRLYSAEFKREAVALASQPGVTKAQIGREMDINPNMITRWQREMTATTGDPAQRPRLSVYERRVSALSQGTQPDLFNE